MQSDLWERGLERLAAELPQQQFNTWIRPLPPAEVTVDGAAVRVDLCAPNRFKMDWIRSQFGARIERTLSELAGQPVRLELHIAGAREAAPAPVTAPAEPPEEPHPPLATPVQMTMLDPPAETGLAGARARTRASARRVAALTEPLVLAADLSPLAQSPALARLAADAAAAASFISARLDEPVAATPMPPPLPMPAPLPQRPDRVPASPTAVDLPPQDAPVAAPAVAASPASGATTASAAPAPSARAGLSLGPIAASAALAKASAAVARRRRAGPDNGTAPAPQPMAAPPAPAPIVARQVPPVPALTGAPAVVIPNVPPPSAPTNTRGRINPLLTFDTLVPGRANQMARTAALHVVGSPGGMYNP
ncbi:MAG: chromosomal replication initiator protein DnaA, partial [Pseudomonadota bacterium]